MAVFSPSESSAVIRHVWWGADTSTMLLIYKALDLDLNSEAFSFTTYPIRCLTAYPKFKTCYSTCPWLSPIHSYQRYTC